MVQTPMTSSPTRIRFLACALPLTACLAAMLSAQTPPSSPPTVQDEYAVYDLLAPESNAFRTVYDVAFTTPGATLFLDKIGSGLTFVAGADDGVVDLMTGAPLKFEQR